MSSFPRRESFPPADGLVPQETARQNLHNGPAPILNSWKEIAQYMGRGVRTVQRWEHELNLPVRRPKGKDRSAVLAIPGELDDWLYRTPTKTNGNGAAGNSEYAIAKLLEIARDLLAEAERLAALDTMQRSKAGTSALALQGLVCELELANNSSKRT